MTKLIKEIEKFKQEVNINVPKHLLEVSLAETKVLQEKKISHKALQVGDIAKEIILPNILGESVSLYENLEKNDFIVLNFYRGIWCPYCNLEIKALQNIKDELSNLNTKIIAISPQTSEDSLNIKEKNNLDFEVLSDLDYKVEKDYGLVYSLSEKLIPIYKSWGFKVSDNINNDEYELPMPATYIINKNKEIIFAFIEEDYTKRCEPSDIVDAIKKNI